MAKTIKEQLKETYQQYLCELGEKHVDTKVAKQLYDNYCMAEQELVHEPNNPDGITAAELKHQLYGAKFMHKHDLAKHAKWIRENVGADVAVDFLKDMEDDKNGAL